MKKNNRLVTVDESTKDESMIEIKNPNDFDFQYRVVLLRDGKEVDRYSGVDQTDDSRNTAKVFLDIDRKTRERWKEDSENEITVWLKKGSKESREKWRKSEREACINYLSGKKLVGKPFTYNKKGEIKCEFTVLDGGKIGLKVFNGKDENDTSKVIFADEQIKEVKLVFYPVTPFTLEDTEDYQAIKTPQSTDEKASFWTGGRIFLTVVIALILFLLFIFRKKIWLWIRGESSQEKKTREQIDIF